MTAGTLTPEFCRERQRRLVEQMQRLDIERVLVRQPENVQWLTGFRPHRLMAAAAALDADGRCVLAAPNEPPENAAVDDAVSFAAQWCCTLRQEQPAAALEVLEQALATRPVKRLGIEAGPAAHLTKHVSGTTLVDIEPHLWKLRRRKEPDELALIARAIDCTEAMYRAARERIAPGLTELELYNVLHSAAVSAAGEPLTHPLGNDFQCNSPGGPPRSRPAAEGELFVLDLGPSYRGYFADSCRTFCVGRPDDVQLRAWEAIVEALRIVERSVRPGVSCRAVYQQVKEHLDAVRPGAFFHHLGHGIGLYPHEAPHLNPHWDDRFEEGDVFTAEPGLYGDDLRAGIRLEENYRVKATGVERLTRFPLDL